MRPSPEIIEQQLLACLYSEERYDRIAAVLGGYFHDRIVLEDCQENRLNTLVVTSDTIKRENTHRQYRTKLPYSEIVREKTDIVSQHCDEPFIMHTSLYNLYELAIRVIDDIKMPIGLIRTAVKRNYRLTPEDDAVMRAAARVVSLAMRLSEHRSVPLGAHVQWNHLLGHLLTGQYKNREMLRRSMETQSVLCHFTQYRLIHATRPSTAFEPSQFQRLAELLETLPQFLGVVQVDGQLAALFEAERGQEVFAHGGPLEEIANLQFLYMVCSDPVTDLWDLPLLHRRNQLALRSVMRRHPAGRYALYDDCRLDCLAANAQPVTGSLAEYLSSCVPEIARYDQENGTAYLDTLWEYFRFQGNITRAAEALYIHKTTMAYRMERIQELFHLDLEDYEKRLQLQLSLYILRHFL